ncbi:hypothetical protein ACI2KR_31060 [Pseudomonas luteola]
MTSQEAIQLPEVYIYSFNPLSGIRFQEAISHDTYLDVKEGRPYFKRCLEKLRDDLGGKILSPQWLMGHACIFWDLVHSNHSNLPDIESKQVSSEEILRLAAFNLLKENGCWSLPEKADPTKPFHIIVVDVLLGENDYHICPIAFSGPAEMNDASIRLAVTSSFEFGSPEDPRTQQLLKMLRASPGSTALN